MAKNLKLTIKNTQIAEAINLGSLKDKLAKKKQETEENSIKFSTLSEEEVLLECEIKATPTRP